MRELPTFTETGVLPVGDYELSLGELARSRLVSGAGVGSLTWDAAWRRTLVQRLGILARQLHRLGIVDIHLHGSFVEDKDHPHDIDGYFTCDRDQVLSGRLQQDLNLIDPHKCWTWDPAERRQYRGYPMWQLPMWHFYRVELYPHVPGLLSGLTDEFGNDLEFPAAFRRSRRDGMQRGIVRLGELA
jgi:hypothetical protein